MAQAEVGEPKNRFCPGGIDLSDGVERQQGIVQRSLPNEARGRGSAIEAEVGQYPVVQFGRGEIGCNIQGKCIRGKPAAFEI